MSTHVKTSSLFLVSRHIWSWFWPTKYKLHNIQYTLKITPYTVESFSYIGVHEMCNSGDREMAAQGMGSPQDRELRRWVVQEMESSGDE